MFEDPMAIVREIHTSFRGLDNVLTSEDYLQAVQDAVHETGWSFPIKDNDKCYWIKERAKRHMMSYLMLEAASKFNIKGINLAQRFDHYKAVVNDCDTRWASFLEANPNLLIDAPAAQTLSHYTGSGMFYDKLGRKLSGYRGSLRPLNE